MHQKFNIRFFRLTLFLVLILVFVQSALAFNLTLSWTAESNLDSAYFGNSVSTGDFNGDGYDDVLVGAYHYSNGETYEGRAYVYYGGLSGISSNADWIAESNQANAYFGCSVSTGDFNGDGYDDVLVGAYHYSNGETHEGRAYVYYGGPSGISTSPAWTAESNQANANFGYSVSSGDFNGDGYDDVLVGAYGYDNGESNEGRAYVYYGGPSGISSSPAWTGESNKAGAFYGISVSSGDFNGDGYDDVLVGSYNYPGNPNIAPEGRAYVYYSGPSGISSEADWIVDGKGKGAYLGRSVSSGDFNADGYDDVLVAAPASYLGDQGIGAVYVYYGSSTGLSTSSAWSAGAAGQFNTHFGQGVSSGDFNGDGYDDVLVGAPDYENGGVHEGRVFIYYGGPSGISSVANWTTEPNQAGAKYGSSVSAGDFNGDGYDDVLFGAYAYDSGETDEGRAYVYFSNLQLPVYSNFISFPHTTNLSAVPDLTNVTNLTLGTFYGMLQFPQNHGVNVKGKNLNSNIMFGDCYVSVNLSGLDYTFNATAYLLINNSDNHCGSNRIYYAPGVYTNADAVRQHDTVCSDCIKLIADTHKVKFKVYHFSSYAIGSNSNLTIYDSYENSAAQPNADIVFYANYTNKSGSHISGATCTIYFDGNTNDKHNMTDNGNNYNYTFSFSTDGTHNYNITCSATNYNTLSAVDDVEVSSVVPEFSGNSLVVISVFVIILGLLLLNKKRK